MALPPSKTGSHTLTDFLLADIVAISADAIICIDEAQRITLFNEGAEQIFGWTTEEVIGQPLEILLPERLRDGHRSHIARFREVPERSRKMGQRQEISGLRKNGEEFPAEAAIAKVAMGDAVVFSVVLRDITEQVELRKRLQRAVSARDDTVGVVAHDLRNPVSAIKMLSSAVQRSQSERMSPEGAEQVQLIHDAAQQMDRLIQDLLDVTRVETGRLVIAPQLITATALLEGALGTLRPLVQEAGLELVVELSSSPVTVNADAERIGQVLSNLVGNAIKATPRGGRITVSVETVGGLAQVAVADTGAGISREQLPHVFDRFWQASQSGIRSRGAGLGLPIARGIIDAHGGRMSVESVQGSGATFFFTLPVAESGT